MLYSYYFTNNNYSVSVLCNEQYKKKEINIYSYYII